MSAPGLREQPSTRGLRNCGTAGTAIEFGDRGSVGPEQLFKDAYQVSGCSEV